MAQQSQGPSPPCFPLAALCGFKPRIRLTAVSAESTSDPLSPSLSAPLSLSLSLSKINLKKNRTAQQEITEGGLRTSICPKCDAGNEQDGSGSSSLKNTSGGNWGPTETGTRWSQPHPRRLIPGSGEGQTVAGQEWQPGDPLATTAMSPCTRAGLQSGWW